MHTPYNKKCFKAGNSSLQNIFTLLHSSPSLSHIYYNKGGFYQWPDGWCSWCFISWYCRGLLPSLWLKPQPPEEVLGLGVLLLLAFARLSYRKRVFSLTGHHPLTDQGTANELPLRYAFASGFTGWAQRRKALSNAWFPCLAAVIAVSNLGHSTQQSVCPLGCGARKNPREMPSAPSSRAPLFTSQVTPVWGLQLEV